MKKQFLSMLFGSMLTISLLVGCGSGTSSQKSSKFQMLDTDLRVGMVTNSGTIDDRSFNQGAWEGIKDTVKQTKYLQPNGATEADYLQQIANLYDADYKFIVTPGYKFETAIYIAQMKYPDAKFVLIDGSPRDHDGGVEVGNNTVAIYFAEQEAGFLAGVAAARQIKEGDFGFIGGMAIPSVKRYKSGFAQGILYANEHLETHISLKDENIIYIGSFDDKAGGQQLSAQMYDRGVKAIFAAAGDVGLGVITEAKGRAAKGEDAWVIGVDVDQYMDGIYETGNNKSVILTSAIKYLDQATYDMIKAEVEGKFPGGQTLTFNVNNNGVGIPKNNPNLSEETVNAVKQVNEQIKAGNIVVSGEE
ncbi:BMP family lipoprotein [Cellulosilyticum sp. WCF-2]|uniref:BMP family lipoprotein n=1 Tax=Cellulosilyticum sp. WCF-2 TaxID=2497860 RepID=UPI000F8CC5E7|nr:BMP family ABC transporter substrate-binding protein [Cellulosilyticum sp. WCF-2]QEH69701.1 BMP family ABC transporter substrate-binding protein [Cellulosilyticum sp. WCF-2]